MSIKEAFNQSLAAAIVRKGSQAASALILGKKSERPTFKKKTVAGGVAAAAVGTMISEATNISLVKSIGQGVQTMGLYFVNDAVVGHAMETVIPNAIDVAKEKFQKIRVKELPLKDKNKDEEV